MAALVVLLWDHCLTFSEEVRLVWPSRANFVKRAFLINRYLVPIILSINMHSRSLISSEGYYGTQRLLFPSSNRFKSFRPFRFCKNILLEA